MCFCITAIFSNAQSQLLQQILTDYYSLKNALVKDDANTASTSAGKLLSDTKNVNVQSLNADEQKAFSSVKDNITYNADHISEVDDIDHQREHFEKLSAAMMQLAENINLSQHLFILIIAR